VNLVNWTKDELSEFLGGKVIHRQHDIWSDILVIDHGSQRVLTFDTIYEQSRMDRNKPAMLVHNYTRAMILGLAFVKPEHVTILGLGGGCLVRAVHALFDEAVLDVVELRQAVAEIAQQYFMLPQTPRIQVTISDAKQYLKKQVTASTDMIFADMYDGYGVHPFQMQERFIQQCHRTLTSSGWLVINCHKLPDFDSPILVSLISLFKEVFVCPVPTGNYIMYAGKSELSASEQSYLQQIVPFQSKIHTKFEFLFNRMIRLSHC